MDKLFNKNRNSYAVWNGSTWEDESTPGAYFYTLEKAANNGWYPVFEYDELPEDIRKLVDDFTWDDMEYSDCKMLQNVLELKGWTCDYGLDAIPYHYAKLETVGL